MRVYLFHICDPCEIFLKVANTIAENSTLARGSEEDMAYLNSGNDILEKETELTASILFALHSKATVICFMPSGFETNSTLSCFY